MKRFALILIVLLCGFITYNLAVVDYSNPSWENNSATYITLIWSSLIVTSLVISYRLFKKQLTSK